MQSLGQLQNRYPKNLWSEIIGNCDIQLMLGCTDDVTAEYISARSGDMSVQVNSTMTVRQTIAVAQVIPQYRHTEGQGRDVYKRQAYSYAPKGNGNRGK